MPDSVLPSNLRGKRHTDWPWPLSLVPRGWTAFYWGTPCKLLGNQKDTRVGSPAPIGEPGSWQFSIYPDAPWWAWALGLSWYVAFSTPRDAAGAYTHFRLGTRYDDVDYYSTIFSIARTRYGKDDGRTPST